MANFNPALAVAVIAASYFAMLSYLEITDKPHTWKLVVSGAHVFAMSAMLGFFLFGVA